MAFDPVGEPVGSNVLRVDFENSASSEEEELHRDPLEVREIPDPGNDQGQGAVQTVAGPVPDHVEGVEDVVEDGEWD